ncbi:hypothetical protein [Chitinophaga qingshengii]|uniref:PepSY domain-containing protein n=1 Tax=Chitinophaga qingshengii TaxID=1569794 RepID=A0ABR7TGI5_9BACT|nr:hypothetical protein [Chitinophaga qingshengii]MBC9929570.1 hypothetical protein [Chitinophaga qingshengii]
MKKMMIYLLATGIGVFAAVPSHAGDTMHRHRTKEERREARAERKEARAEKREAKRSGMVMHNDMASPMPSTTNNTMRYPEAALPVMEDYIPSNIMSNLKTTYGSDLYDITSMKCTSGSDCYTVRVIKNGVVQSFVVNADGNTVVQ